MIIKIRSDLIEERAKDKKPQNPKPTLKADKAVDSPLEILKLIDQMRQTKQSRQMAKATPEERKSITMANNAKQAYLSRKSRG